MAQVTVVHYVAFHFAVPSFVLIVVIWYAIRVDAQRATLYGLAAGLCEDALAPQTGAAWTISTTLCATLTSLLSRGFFSDSIPLVSAVTAVATLLRALLFWTVMRLFGYPAGLGTIHYHEALISAVLNVCVMVIAMLVARRFGVAER